MARPGVRSPNRLRDLRERGRLSRDALAAQAGITTQSIYRIEGGGSANVRTAQKIARVLSKVLGRTITTDDIFPPARAKERAS